MQILKDKEMNEQSTGLSCITLIILLFIKLYGLLLYSKFIPLLFIYFQEISLSLSQQANMSEGAKKVLCTTTCNRLSKTFKLID